MGYSQTPEHRNGKKSYHQIGLVRGQFGDIPYDEWIEFIGEAGFDGWEEASWELELSRCSDDAGAAEALSSVHSVAGCVSSASMRGRRTRCPWKSHTSLDQLSKWSRTAWLRPFDTIRFFPSSAMNRPFFASKIVETLRCRGMARLIRSSARSKQIFFGPRWSAARR